MATARKAGTGLERTTKSIPLSGGIVEEVDDFLIEPAGMQYMENVRFTKVDMCEKAEPTSYLSVTGGANYTVNAYGMWSKGDRVAILENNNLLQSANAGSTWTVHEQNTDLLGIEKILSTAEVQGGINFTWAPMGIKTTGPEVMSISHYAVAYETYRRTGTTLDTLRSLVVQIYTATDGALVYEKDISDGQMPQMHIGDDLITTHLFYANDAGNLVIESGNLGTLTFSVDSTTALGFRDYCGTYNSTDKGYGPTGTVLNGGDMRLGHNNVTTFENAQFKVFSEMDTTSGAIAWKTSSEVRWQRVVDGALSGSAQVLVTDSSPTFYQMLDVCTYGFNCYTLVAETDTTASATSMTTLWVYEEVITGGTATRKSVGNFVDGIAVNGTIRIDSGNVFTAVTVAGGPPHRRMGDGPGRHQIWAQYSPDFFGTPGTAKTYKITSHRLCSNAVFDKNGNPFAVVQQWDNWNPSQGSIGADPVVPALTLGHKKPVTSVLVRFDTSVNETIEVCGTFDAGQSKAMPGSLDEVNLHTNNLFYWDDSDSPATDLSHSFWYGNRNILSAEDAWYFLANTSPSSWPANEMTQMLTPGSAKMNLYRLQSGIRVPYTNFPNGMIVGTSIPAWYDGSTDICAVSPIDSPEIVGIAWGATDGGSYTSYQDLGLPSESSKVFQAVMGYYDDAGLAHRSAPSIPVYSGNGKASDTTGELVTIYVTPPLTLANDRNYFVEIYESLPGETPTMCNTANLADGDAGSIVLMWHQSNISPGTQDLDIAPFRAAKVLYTEGSVLASDPWPSFDLLAKSGRRLFAHSIGDPSAIYYSKLFENGIAPEFSASLLISLGNEKITALGAMDDKVVAWTATDTWFLYGTGPDNTGANGDFFVEKMPHAIGCTDPESVVQFQDGLAFYSSNTKEFKLLTRDMKMMDLGENIKVMTAGSDFNVVRSLVYPAAEEIRWYCEQTPGPEWLPDSSVNSPVQPSRPFLESQTPLSPVFVFNYKYKKWSVLSDGSQLYQIVGIVNEKPAGLKAWNYYETSTDWTDSELMKQETPWIKVNQLQDFGRFYGLEFLGRYLSSWDNGTGDVESGDIQVTIRYDYEGVATASDEVHRWRANRDLNQTSGDRLQFKIMPKRQKCQAIKVIIEEVPTTKVEVSEPDYANGRGYIITGMDIHYGMKNGSGGKTLPAARRK